MQPAPTIAPACLAVSHAQAHAREPTAVAPHSNPAQRPEAAGSIARSPRRSESSAPDESTESPAERSQVVNALRQTPSRSDRPPSTPGQSPVVPRPCAAPDSSAQPPSPVPRTSTVTIAPPSSATRARKNQLPTQAASLVPTSNPRRSAQRHQEASPPFPAPPARQPPVRSPSPMAAPLRRPPRCAAFQAQPPAASRPRAYPPQPVSPKPPPTPATPATPATSPTTPAPPAARRSPAATPDAASLPSRAGASSPAHPPPAAVPFLSLPNPPAANSMHQRRPQSSGSCDSC